MKIKAIFFTFCFLCLNVFITTAQEHKASEQTYKPKMEQYDYFAKQIYGDDIQTRLYENTWKNNFYKDLFKNRLTIIKTENPPHFYFNISEIPLYKKEIAQKLDMQFDPYKFNPFNYKLNYYNKEKMYYQIDNTNYYISIEKFNANIIKK